MQAGRSELSFFFACSDLCQWNLAKLASASSALLSSAEGSKLLSIPYASTVLFPVAYHVMQLYEGIIKLLSAFVPEALPKKITRV